MGRWHTHDADMLPLEAFQPRFGRRGSMRLYGGKGNSAPPPDPRLVEAQIKSLGIQDSAIEGVLQLAREMQPLQKEQMQFGLDAARTAFNQSQDDRGWMLGRRQALSGMQDQLIEDAKSFNTEDRREQLAGQAIGDVRQAFNVQRDMAGRNMARMGINPNDGKFAAMQSQMGIAEALGQSQAANGARDRARQEGYALTDRATNALAGYPAMGMQATGQGAQFAASGINLANQGAAGMMSGFNTAGGMAGQMGNNATNMWGAQANYSANMQQGDSLGGILGGVGGLAMGLGKNGLGWFSDRRLKQDIELVGRDERTGLNLYEFGYIDDPDKRRYVGVMADEVIAYDPRAVSFDEHGYAQVDYARLGIPFKEVV